MNETKGRHGSVVENNFWAELQFRLFHHSSSGFKAKQKVINPDQCNERIFTMMLSEVWKKISYLGELFFLLKYHVSPPEIQPQPIL